MSRKSVPSQTAEQHVREIRRRIRKQYSSEGMVRIVLSGLRHEMDALKQLVADLTVENRLLKKIPTGLGETANEVPRV